MKQFRWLYCLHLNNEIKKLFSFEKIPLSKQFSGRWRFETITKVSSRWRFNWLNLKSLKYHIKSIFDTQWNYFYHHLHPISIHLSYRLTSKPRHYPYLNPFDFRKHFLLNFCQFLCQFNIYFLLKSLGGKEFLNIFSSHYSSSDARTSNTFFSVFKWCCKF